MYYHPVKVGGELYLNRNYTPDNIRMLIKKMHDSKLELIRIFISWDSVEPQKNTWNFDIYDICFREAEDRGLKIIPTLSSINAPNWIKKDILLRDDVDYHSDRIRKRAEMYIKKTVKRYYSSPALHSWILWNEPSRHIVPDRYGIKGYISFLLQKYDSDIQKLNFTYGKSYESFEEAAEAQTVMNKGISPFKPYAEQLDWIRFSVHDLSEYVEFIRKTVRSIDSVHPVHINPHNIGQNIGDQGQSIWCEAKHVDFLGVSAHPVWHSTRFLSDRIHQSIAYFSDLLKSATLEPDGVFWIDELQGGPTVFSGNKYSNPTSGDIKHWMWEAIGAGARGILFWAFNCRDEGREAGEWGLLNQLDEPSDRLRAVSETIELLNKNNTAFANAKPQKPDVWLLFSEDTWNLGIVEGFENDVDNPRNRQMGPDALCGAYLMCSDIGLQVGFINEGRLINEGLPEGSTIILPGTYSIRKEVWQVLDSMVQKGVTIIGDGLCGLKNENGQIAKGSHEIMERIFGAKLLDIGGFYGDNEISSKSDGCVEFNGWFVKCLMEPSDEAEILAAFKEGEAAVIKKRYGKGCGIRIATALFQRYLTEPDIRRSRFLSRLLENSLNNKSIKLMNCSSNLRMKILESEGYKILILMNSSNEDQVARIKSSFKGQLCTIDEQIISEMSKDVEMLVPVKKGEIRVLKFI